MGHLPARFSSEKPLHFLSTTSLCTKYRSQLTQNLYSKVGSSANAIQNSIGPVGRIGATLFVCDSESVAVWALLKNVGHPHSGGHFQVFPEEEDHNTLI